MSSIKFPFGPADYIKPAHAATLSVAISDPGLTIIEVAANAATAVTLDLTFDVPPVNGSQLIVRYPNGSTARTLTLGGVNIAGPGLATGAINKNFVLHFVFMNDKYYQVAAALQLD